MAGIWRCASLTVALVGCTVYNTPNVSEVTRPAPRDSVHVSTPVKAHLLDGSTVVYPAGIEVVQGNIYSAVGKASFRYGLTLRDSTPAAAIPLDSVAGLETFQNSVNGPASVAVTLLGTGVTVFGGALLAVAIFGSCPTVYGDSAGTPVLQAEGFSYSIAPLFEARDVDRLAGSRDSTGTLRLEVRNEALETHYINQMAVLQVSRGTDEDVVTTARGEPLAVRALAPPASARDRAENDVREQITLHDGRTFSTSNAVVDRATAQDAADVIALTFPRPEGRDSVALVFRMRNSLLNTVLLYELMLGEPGLRSLDWIGHDLMRIDAAAELALWYSGNFAMRVAIQDGDGFREIGRVADTGPIAWKDVAVLLPVPQDADSLRIRLTFLADDWRIDRIGLASDWRRPAGRLVPAAAVTDSVGHSDTAALAGLRDADDHYLVTQPGNRFFLHFAPDPAPTDSASAFLLVSQGYYTEWVRGHWLRQHPAGEAFRPDNGALLEALHRWRRQAPDFERRFYATRFAVR